MCIIIFKDNILCLSISYSSINGKIVQVYAKFDKLRYNIRTYICSHKNNQIKMGLIKIITMRLIIKKVLVRIILMQIS